MRPAQRCPSPGGHCHAQTSCAPPLNSTEVTACDTSSSHIWLLLLSGYAFDLHLLLSTLQTSHNLSIRYTVSGHSASSTFFLFNCLFFFSPVSVKITLKQAPVFQSLGRLQTLEPDSGLNTGLHLLPSPPCLRHLLANAPPRSSPHSRLLTASTQAPSAGSSSRVSQGCREDPLSSTSAQGSLEPPFPGPRAASCPLASLLLLSCL